MTERPEALRLADALDYGVYDAQMARVMDKAAAELRRLHAENKRLSWDSIHTCHAECQRPVCRLTRERDALLEALREYRAAILFAQDKQALMSAIRSADDKARAAIAKAEEKT